MENLGIDIVNYSRQESMEADLEEYELTNNIIIGCGGVGFWLGLHLAMLGSKRFFLIEGDKIEPTNLNRIPVPQTWIGMNKAKALSKTIRLLRPDSIIGTTGMMFNEHVKILSEIAQGIVSNYARDPHLFTIKTTVWDTTDDARIQQVIYKEYLDIKSNIIIASNIKYRKLGYEGWDVGVYNNYEVWGKLPDDYRPGYTSSRANSVSSAMVACLGILSALNKDQQKDVSLNLMKLAEKGA